MEKVLVVVLAVLISVAFVPTGFAQIPTEKPASESKMVDKDVMKPNLMRFTGEVTNMDMEAKTMAVKGEKGDMTFDISKAQMIRGIKAGDKVSVNYMEKDGKMMATSIIMTAGMKMNRYDVLKQMKMQKQMQMQKEMQMEQPAPAPAK